MRSADAMCSLARMQASRDDSRFVAVLGQIMDRTGLKPQGLASATGTDPSVVSRWLSGGTRRPKPETVEALTSRLVEYDPTTWDLVAPLFESLGYMPVLPPEPDPYVIEHWEDENVRKLWRLRVRRGKRVLMIRELSMSDQIPDDAPLCTFESVIMAEDELPDDIKAFVIHNHRRSGHTNCRWLTETRPEQQRALA